MPRVSAAESAFTATLRAAQRESSQGKATITKTEAEKALGALHGADNAGAIVQAFLEGKQADALSAKARQALVDFVSAHRSPLQAGATLVDVKAQVSLEAGLAERAVHKAQARLDELIAHGTKNKAAVQGALGQVRAWLDAAAADVVQAKQQLKKLAKDAAAKIASKDLGAAAKELERAHDDVEKLIAVAKTGGLKKSDLAELREWLKEPVPDIHHAATALSSNATTGGGPSLKYPSDAEDAVAPHTGGGTSWSAKYPSDNEDGGGGVITSDRKVSTAHASAMKKAFAKADHAGALAWKKGACAELHRTVRFARVDLGSDGNRDGFRFVAFIPTGALTPTAHEKDPNKVSQFYVERTGAKRGTTETTGPLSL